MRIGEDGGPLYRPEQPGRQSAAREPIPLSDPNIKLRAAWSTGRQGSGLHLIPRRRGLRARHSAHRRRCAAAIRALPSVVLGPVERPPWKRQRRLPGSTLTRQGAPVWVQAPQRGRSLRRSGERSPASPISARRLHLPPIPQAELSKLGLVLPGRRSSRADARGSSSLASRMAAAAWPGRHQWGLGVQPPFAALPLIIAPEFFERMSCFVRFLVKAHDAHTRDPRSAATFYTDAHCRKRFPANASSSAGSEMP